LVKQIDSDSDGFVTHDEMKEWIAKQLRRYIYHDIEGQFSSSDQNQDKLVSWDEYKNTTYSYMDDTDDDPNMKQMINRDKRRFDMADVDKDGKLGTEEFVYFIHPEESKHMGGIIIDVSQCACLFVSVKMSAVCICRRLWRIWIKMVMVLCPFKSTSVSQEMIQTQGSPQNG
jgi:hypothetical protein